MALRGTLVWLCSLSVLAASSATPEPPQSCNSEPQELSSDIQKMSPQPESREWRAVHSIIFGTVPLTDQRHIRDVMFRMLQQAAAMCSDNTTWSGEQAAAVLLSMRNLADILHKHLQKECRGTQPSNCSEPEIPDNGGLACVTVGDRRYCKPLCNHGYDFAFLRRSRIFEECSAQTRYKWNTQYVGGNKLAVCNEASLQISGVDTAYFPKDQDCLTTRSRGELFHGVRQAFEQELKAQGLKGKVEQYCLVCGRT